jgi:hypothetical protein
MPGKPWLIQPGDHKWVTTIKCINSTGWSVLLTIIFKGKHYREGWFEELSILHAWRIKVSNNR